ncbi:hypothetical protein ZX31_24115 [Salmonella enterica subsp. enterica serovar Typhimurium]|nr:hypothetical protein [Salmonella enterica subsp. enterica serovar Typhimurium]ECY5853652.1 hypothetical protein [Salmonella enterica subsp. enterica serovar Typhimurium]EDH4223282.1 hypothetical protein [Salmonella enterica subsp. enterica serovar Typhimurium]EDT0032261.1 hypothetical protein [Salmonella enterica subsp. enterica]
MIKFLKVAVLLSSTFAASCFAASSQVVDTNAAVVLEQIKTQNAETNALLKELVKQNAGRVSEQAQTSCYFDGKLYTQGAVVDEGKQFCGEENGSPKIRPIEKK